MGLFLGSIMMEPLITSIIDFPFPSLSHERILRYEESYFDDHICNIENQKLSSLLLV